MYRLRNWMLIGFIALSIALNNPIGPVTAQEKTQTIYIVQPGDTLDSIARRYDRAVMDLATANGLINPQLVFVGQKLVIPAAPKATAQSGAPPAKRLYVVRPDDTLFSIALKYDTTQRSWIAVNQLDQAGFVVPGQQLIIPDEARSNEAAVAQPGTPLPAPLTNIEISPLPLQQGSLIEITVHASQPVTLTGDFGGAQIPFALDGDRYIGLAGVGAHPVTGIMPGLHTIVITATDASGLPVIVSANLQIKPGHFNSEYILLSSDRQQLLDPALLAAEANKLNATWTVFNPQRYWSGPFRVPVDQFIRISSPFGTRRSYGGGPMTSYHEGTDFAVPAGTPVYAPADGVVMIAEPLAVRGNAVVIDHGWGVYSGLYHLSEIKVTPGQHVKQGDLIGLSGNTGLSTGAHLHWDFRLRGLNLDALQLTQQVFP